MKLLKNIKLSEYTSFGVGGLAKELAIFKDSIELKAYLISNPSKQYNLLGYGTNVLISDGGLPGTTLITRSKKIEYNENEVIVDAGVWWDDLVTSSINSKFFGLELMSGIPGGIGGAVFINITAYGQSASDSLVWIECLKPSSGEIKRFNANEIDWGYKDSVFQKPEHLDLIILRACFKLSKTPTCELTYQSALDVAKELKLDTNNLNHRRQIILEARNRAGSLYIPNMGYEKTVGSFFRNPKVTKEQAEQVIKFDETGKTKEQITKMNQVHGGDLFRVSAAHVMLAAGYRRGQSWGNVRLHPKNLLKIENVGGASAQEIYNVAIGITKTVKSKLDIDLTPEARILGKFD